MCVSVVLSSFSRYVDICSALWFSRVVFWINRRKHQIKQRSEKKKQKSGVNVWYYNRYIDFIATIPNVSMGKQIVEPMNEAKRYEAHESEHCWYLKLICIWICDDLAVEILCCNQNDAPSRFSIASQTNWNCLKRVCLCKEYEQKGLLSHVYCISAFFPFPSNITNSIVDCLRTAKVEK